MADAAVAEPSAQVVAARARVSAAPARPATKETATAFWNRAQAYYASVGITVERVLTDNGSCYKSYARRDVLAAAGITHKRTRPYRPQTNGKVERLNRTLLDEWAYARPYRSEQERRDAFPNGCTRSQADHPPAASPTSLGTTTRTGSRSRIRPQQVRRAPPAHCGRRGQSSYRSRPPGGPYRRTG